MQPPTPPRVSVIVPVRDDAARLRLCLDALARQTLPVHEREIVVVDNGSCDDVDAVVRGYPGVRLVREPRRGSYAARNRGLLAASAPLLAFTDADCVPAEDWLEQGLEALRAPEVDVVAGAIEVFFTRGRPNAIELHDALTAFPQEHFVERYGFGATASLFTRRDVFDRVGSFDGSLQSGGDAEWGERAAAAGHRIVYRAGAVVRHPARRRLGELYEKITRITRGIEQMARARGDLTPVGRALGRHLGRPWRALPSILRDARLPGPWDKLRFFAVALLLDHLAALEIARGRSVRGCRGWRSASSSGGRSPRSSPWRRTPPRCRGGSTASSRPGGTATDRRVSAAG